MAYMKMMGPTWVRDEDLAEYNLAMTAVVEPGSPIGPHGCLGGLFKGSTVYIYMYIVYDGLGYMVAVWGSFNGVYIWYIVYGVGLVSGSFKGV